MSQVLTWGNKTTKETAPSVWKTNTEAESRRSNSKGRGLIGQSYGPDEVRKTTISEYQRKCHRHCVSKISRKAHVFFASW